jgi:hypothetical protein
MGKFAHPQAKPFDLDGLEQQRGHVYVTVIVEPPRSPRPKRMCTGALAFSIASSALDLDARAGRSSTSTSASIEAGGGTPPRLSDATHSTPLDLAFPEIFAASRKRWPALAYS